MAAFDVTYSIDGVSFATYGIIVTATKGLISKPVAKDALSAELDGHNGVMRDLENLRYKGREVELSCVMEANGYSDFITKANGLISLISTGTHTLSWKPGSATTKTMTVIHPKQLNISKGWDPVKMVGTFQLKFEELTPPIQSRLISSYSTPAEPTDNDVHYYIDGSDLAARGVYVESSSGLFNKPQEKDSLTVDWYGSNGVQKDTSSLRYDERTIDLNCFVTASSYTTFMTVITNICMLVGGTGTHRLRVQAKGSLPLVYEVYHPNQVNITPNWNAKTCVGTFTLKLVEPEPVKIVLRCSGTASITIASKSIAHIYWGDGTHTFDVSGDGKAQTVTKTLSGSCEVIITVETTDVTQFSHNGTVIWNRLL